MAVFASLGGGYLALFLLSFAAATLVPASSEVAVALMVGGGYGPLTVVLVATAGNSLGAGVNYLAGRWGRRFVLNRWVRADSVSLDRARRACDRWGAPVLFFAWLPVVGDPLTLAAGVLKIGWERFLFWVVLGKAFRYAAIVTGTMAAVG